MHTLVNSFVSFLPKNDNLTEVIDELLDIQLSNICYMKHRRQAVALACLRSACSITNSGNKNQTILSLIESFADRESLIDSEKLETRMVRSYHRHKKRRESPVSVTTNRLLSRRVRNSESHQRFLHVQSALAKLL